MIVIPSVVSLEGDNCRRDSVIVPATRASVANQDFREMSSTLEIVRNPRHSPFTEMTWAFRPARARLSRDFATARGAATPGDSLDGGKWTSRDVAVSATDVIRNAPSDDSGRIGNGDSASELLTDSS